MSDLFSKIAIGTVQFGLDYGISNSTGMVSYNEAKLILKNAKDKSINFLDTAIAYGESEKVLGKIGVADWNVVTKIPSLSNFDVSVKTNTISEYFNKSLERLKQDKLYCLMLHDSRDLLSENSKIVFQELEKLKRDSLIKKIGVSVYDINSLKTIIEKYSIDLVQIPLNIFDQSFIKDDFLKTLKSKNIEIHARSSFLQGLLLMSKNERPSKFLEFKNQFADYDSFLIENNISPLSACLSFVKNIDEVDKVVVGVQSSKQLDEICTEFIKNEKLDFSKLSSSDLELINPSRWGELK